MRPRIHQELRRRIELVQRKLTQRPPVREERFEWKFRRTSFASRQSLPRNYECSESLLASYSAFALDGKRRTQEGLR